MADTYEFVHRTLAGDGTITAQITSLTGVTSTNPANGQAGLSSSRPDLAAWAKAGLLVTSSTRQGSAYLPLMTERVRDRVTDTARLLEQAAPDHMQSTRSAT